MTYRAAKHWVAQFWLISLVVLLCLGGHSGTSRAQEWFNNTLGRDKMLRPFLEGVPGTEDLHISGLYQNTTAMWVNSAAIRYNKSHNSLSAERSLWQVDVNLQPDED